MDLSGVANWAQIIGVIQQLPQTILGIRELLKGHEEEPVVGRFVGQLTKLTDSFFVLGELKTLHDESQMLHNSFQKVISITTGDYETLPISYITQNWRFAKPEFERFFAKIDSFRHIKEMLPTDDIELLKSCIITLDSALKQSRKSQDRNYDDIIDETDRIQARVAAILTRADQTLKQAIDDIYKGILGVERGLRSNA